MPGNRKLTDENVAEIRRLYGTGYSQGRLAAMFTVSATYIGLIVRYEVRQTSGIHAIRGTVLSGHQAPSSIASAIPHIPAPRAEVEDLSSDEVEDLEQDLDHQLSKAEHVEGAILAKADEIDRLDQQQLARDLQTHGPPRSAIGRPVPKVPVILTLEQLAKLAPSNRYILLAEEEPALVEITRKVLTSLPQDAWESDIPGLLIEKAVREKGK